MSKKALFLDRDGVVNIDHGYVHKISDFDFIDGVFDLALRATKFGYLIIVITNQAGIGRGMYTEHDFHILSSHMKNTLQRMGCFLDHIYFCPFHPTEAKGEYLKDSVVRFTAKAGENITKGQSVYISGISGEVPVVSLADADDTNKMPAFGLAESTVSTNGSIEVTSNGTLAGIDTSSYALGDILYISTTAGSLTNDPSGLEASKVQNIGMVQRVHASNGSIKVGGAGRTNATTNLNDGNIFVGNSSNKSVSDAFTDVLNDQAGINSSANATAITIDSSENVGIGVTSPDEKLVIYKAIGYASDSALYSAYAVNSTAVDNNKAFKWRTGITGNQTGHSLTFSTLARTESSYVERMRITGTGNVGIGTTGPSDKLDILATTGPQIRLSRTATNYSTLYSDSAGGLVLSSYSSGTSNYQIFSINSSEKVRIINSGNVGIGTTIPQTKLAIGSAQGSGIDFLYDATNNYKHQIKNYWNSNADSRMDFNIGRTSGQTPETIMSVGYGGNVGIGTTTPLAKLDIHQNSFFTNGF